MSYFVRNAKKLGVTHFVLEIKCVENYPHVETLPHIIQHDLLGFTVKNIKGESTGVNNPSCI